MTAWTLIARSLRFHWRANLGVLLGAALGGTVLTGALAVGDSVRHTLREMALARLGKVQLALATRERTFRAALAPELHSALRAPAAPLLRLPGTAARGDGQARAPNVNILGVDERFGVLSGEGGGSFRQALAPGEVILNEGLAAQLHARSGEPVVLRANKPSRLSRDAPLSPEEGASVALRLRVRAIVSDDGIGRFSLQANQVPPFNAFVALKPLQKKMKVSGRANLLLLGGTADLAQAGAALKACWQLADAGLELRAVPGRGEFELRSGRIFLDPPAAEAARRAAPQGRGVLTYLVNEIRKGGRATPYSMVAAMGAPVVPPGMSSDEIVVNTWLADDLRCRPGDTLELAYFVIGPLRKLEERRHSFRVRAVVPLTGAAADRELMPLFPGLASSENCRDWDPGFPLKLKRIRDKDEAYWDQYRGTPKAFVTLAAGQRMWANRFGNLTAIRFPQTGASLKRLESALRETLDPVGMGLIFRPVRKEALAATAQAMDFGQLFLGFSFFLIAAALLLMGLLFVFGVEQRAEEVGTLLALGFRARQVRRLWLWEGGVLALLGGLAGLAGGSWYARGMLYGLSTVWREAVRTSVLHYYAAPATLGMGALASTVVAWAAIWFVLRKQARRPARELLAGGNALGGEESGRNKPGRGKAAWVALLSGAGGVALVAMMGARKDPEAAGAFFGAGALFLTAGLALGAVLLSALGRSRAAARLTVGGMGLRNDARRRGRSLAVVGLLACGSFLVVAVGANRQDPAEGAARRSAGTGGFAFYAETALPVVHDLNAAAGRAAFSLDEKAMQATAFVPFRVREGDEASCLNLNRAQTPRLLGVRPEALAGRKAFTFAEVLEGDSSGRNPWLLLNEPLPDGSIPAIGDQNSILWALGKKVGGTLDYVDERGRPFRVRIVGALANSILQGSLVIAEKRFTECFPSESGYRTFLIDAPPERSAKIGRALERALRDTGLVLTPAVERLAAFNAIQNTYLSTFAVLGGLGLLLGSLGLGIVVLRNVWERRGELALLRALGFRPRTLQWLLFSEHGALLLYGLACGVAAALVAVFPALRSPGVKAPYGTLALLIGAVLLSGAVWTYLATWLALRGRLLNALRNE